MSKLILSLIFILIISTRIIKSRRINFFRNFTSEEKLCPALSGYNGNNNCTCNLTAESSDIWMNYEEHIDIAFAPDKYIYDFYRMSSVTSEPSPDGFILLSDKFVCPNNGEPCELIFSESNSFSVVSDYEQISNMGIYQWNNYLLRRGVEALTSETSYKCIFRANQTGYLAVRPVMEKVLGWYYHYSCYTNTCGWPWNHPCSECPKIYPVDQEDCNWLGKAPKIDFNDGGIVGDHYCVVAQKRKTALTRVNKYGLKSKSVFHPIKIVKQVN